MDAFWGDRAGGIVDPFGHRWSLATHIKDLSREEIDEGAKAAFAKMS
jgi:PhnB protein